MVPKTAQPYRARRVGLQSVCRLKPSEWQKSFDYYHLVIQMSHKLELSSLQMLRLKRMTSLQGPPPALHYIEQA
jgi:hypothetical protein